MTSYQARLKEIRELKTEVEELYRQKHELAQQDIESRIKQYTRTYPDKYFIEPWPHITEREQEQLIFPKARKFLIAFALFGMAALIVGSWLHNSSVAMVGLIFLIGVTAAGAIFLVFDKEIIEKAK